MAHHPFGPRGLLLALIHVTCQSGVKITVVTATIALYIEIQPLNLSVAKRLRGDACPITARHTYYGNGQISLTETLEKHT
jgi:hypothetical protein